MLEFLTQSHVRGELKSQVLTAKRLRFAVAFWGTDAVELLGLNKTSARVQVVCDLYSGAVNPTEIAKLLERRNDIDIEVRMRRGLHSKVYLFDDDAVVLGSSNASVNGLGTEDDEVSDHDRVEANVLVRSSPDNSASSKFVEDVRKWFDEEIWSSASEIEREDLEAALALWARRRRDRPQPKEGILAQALIDPAVARDRGIYILWYRGGLPNYERNVKRKRQETAQNNLELFGLFDNMPDKGVLVAWEQANGRVSFNGLWKRNHGPDIPDDEEHHCVLPQRAMQKPKVADWRLAVQAFVKATSSPDCDGAVIPLEDFLESYGPKRSTP